MSLQRILGPEEKRIRVDILGEFRCLTEEQVIRSIYYKDAEVVKRIINGLKKNRYVLENTPGYLTISPRDEKDDAMIDAYWVFLKNNRIIPFGDFFRADEPAQIEFIAHKKKPTGEIIDAEFVICACSASTSHNIKKLLTDEKFNMPEEDRPHFLFVTRTKADFKACRDRIPDKWRDQNLIMMGCIDYDNPLPNGEPDIHWKKV